MIFIIAFIIYNLASHVIIIICYELLIEAMHATGIISIKSIVIFFVTQFCFMLFCTVLEILFSCSCFVLKAVNKTLKSCINNPGKLSDSDIIRQTSMIYVKLCDIYGEIMKIFFLGLLVLILFCVVSIITFIYTVFMFIQKPIDLLFFFTLLMSLWVIMFSPVFCFLAGISSKVLSESERTADLVQQLANKSGDLKVLKNCKNFILLIAHLKPIVSCVLFELNWKTVFLIVGSIFNYSIIMIQFYDGSSE